MILSRSQDVLPYSRSQEPPPLKFPLVLLKRTIHKNLITQFDTFPSKNLHTIYMRYFSLVHHINSTKYLNDSRRRIHFFVPPGIINAINSRSTTLCITKTYITCGQTYAYPLTQPSINAYGYFKKPNTSLSKFI